MATLRDKTKRNEIRHQLYADLAAEGLSISKAVKALRKVLGKDQVEFARTVKVSVSVLRRIEQERGNVTLRSVQKILAAFSLRLVVKR